MTFKDRLTFKSRFGAAAAASVLVAGGVTAGFALSGGAHHNLSVQRAQLAASTCTGPTGAAYVADAGWDGFTAVETANCAITQTYNVDDPGVPGDPDDSDYASTDEGIALHGTSLYFANTGTSAVAVIDTSDLDPSNYNPDEKLINVGMFPEDLAVTPSGKQLWVADTGPQTSPSWKSGLTVINTGTDKVEAKLSMVGAPTQVTFSPNGRDAYVTSSKGLSVYGTSSRKLLYTVKGLGDPEDVAAAPNGHSVYVTETQQGTVAVISTTTHKVTRTIKVGQEPWQLVTSSNGRTLYVADPDSDAVSVISTRTSRVTKTLRIPGDPDAVALTPNGQDLWVGENAAGTVTVIATAKDIKVGSINLGGGAQEGDGYEPTGIVLTSTPTPSS